MRNDLSDGKDKVERRVDDHLVDFYGHGLLPKALGDLSDERGGNLADFDDIVSPIVSVELFKGDVAVHGRNLLFGHGNMGSQGLEELNLHVVLHAPVVCRVGNQSCIGEAPCVVGHDHEDALGLSLLQGRDNH